MVQHAQISCITINNFSMVNFNILIILNKIIGTQIANIKLRNSPKDFPLAQQLIELSAGLFLCTFSTLSFFNILISTRSRYNSAIHLF